jgi:nucleoside-diphosphate-sugar epimerase
MPELAIVTGAPGWVGSRFVRLLVGGSNPDWPAGRPVPSYARVRCLVAAGAAGDDLGEAEIVPGDLRDPATVGRLMRGSDGADVFHLAGVIHPRGRVRELREVNDLGTRLLVAHSTAVRRLVALSSNSPVGVSRDPAALFDEDTPPRPYMAYGRSKLAMEDAVRRAPVDAVILRPCWFYGPGQPPRQTQFFRMVREGRAPIVGGGHARRSISYVDAIAAAALLAAVVPAAGGGTYWIADPRPYPVAEIVATVKSVLADDFGLTVAPDRLRLPGMAADLAQFADAALQRAGLYNQQLHVLGELNKTIACSVARARSELGWSPGPGLREGMRRSVQWCLDRGEQI